MSRLAIKIDGTYVPNKDKGYSSYDVVQKLGRLEDLAEQGRLIVLPCKVGDTVYCITIDNNIHNLPVQDIYHALVLKSNKTGELRKGYYRTKAEAEAKLAELKGDEE